jgi:hypothetical protein
MAKVRVNYTAARKGKHIDGRITLDWGDDELENEDRFRDAVRERHPGFAVARYELAPKKGIEHEVRTKDGGTKILDEYARKRAIHVFCTECYGWEGDPSECPSTMCALWPFRGKTLAAYHSADDGEGEEEA